jgi:putative Ca2+/H+ antiporter (TMEM165/GDT1 family)
LRKRCHDTIPTPSKLGDNADPGERSSAAEITLAASSEGIWFAVIGHFNRGHRLCKVLAHFAMLIQHMLPRRLVHLDETALGVVSLTYDMVFNDAAKARYRYGRGLRFRVA